MKSTFVVAVLVCVVLATGAWASPLGGTPRALGMGGAAIGVADDAGAWFQNPAGLAALNVPTRDDSEWGHDVLGSFNTINDLDIWGLTWSAHNPDDAWGVGAGIVDVESAVQLVGAGAGVGIRNTGFSVGANVIDIDPKFGPGGETIVNAGGMYRWARGDNSPIRIGVTALDVTDESGIGPVFNAGVGVPLLNDRLLVAVDVVDFTEELGDLLVSGGAELALGETGRWKVRAGAMDTGSDHEFTAGVGVTRENWRADFGWINTDPDNFFSFGVGVNL